MTSISKKLAAVAATLLFAPMALAGQNLATDVTRAIENDPIAAKLNVDVRADGDAIVLEGSASDDRSADAAVIAAAKVPGVNTIINNIRIS